MSEQPRKVKVLTRLRIDEVSAVDKGAGEGVRVVLMKRDPDANELPPLSNAEKARAQLEGRAALRDQEEMEKRAERDRDDERFDFFHGIFTGVNKTFAADAEGDEADDQDKDTPAAELDGHVISPAKKHRPITFDTTDGTRMKFPNERALAEWLAIQFRIHKSTTTEAIMDHKTKLTELAKRAGAVAIAKVIVEDDNSYGITEHELTALVVECAKRDNPDLTDAQAFAKIFTDQSEAGVVLRRAFAVAKNAAYQSNVDESEAACRELAEIGKQRWPSLTRAQQFARAAETNPQLLAKAHRRPSPLSTFPFPKY